MSSTLLLAWYNDPDLRPLAVDRLVREVKETLSATPWHVHTQPALRGDDLAQLLRRHRPAVLQLVCHGTDQGRMILDSELDGVRSFSADALAELIAGGAHVPEAVVLAACHSARLGHALLARGVPVVVATTAPTPDVALDRFSSAFYAALRDGASYAVAFEAGRRQVHAHTEGKEGDYMLLLGEGAERRAPQGAPTPPLPELEGRADLDQVVIWLDIDADQPPQEEIARRMPDLRRQRSWMRATAYGAPRLDRDHRAVTVPWQDIGEAIATMGRVVRSATSPPRVFVAGCAPLAAFALLGAELSSWKLPITLLHYRRFDKQWDVVHLDQPAPPRAPIFDRVEGFTGRDMAPGRLGLYVSCFGDPAHAAAARHLGPEAAAGLATLSTQSRLTLTPADYLAARAELVHRLTELRTAWPEARGLNLYMRVPAPLAFLLGQALNPRLYADVLATDFADHAYRPALPIPWPAAPR